MLLPSFQNYREMTLNIKDIFSKKIVNIKNSRSIVERINVFYCIFDCYYHSILRNSTIIYANSHLALIYVNLSKKK